ncbi:MAG: DUF255 domain-containing protein [Tepidisphaeraceae bacterium]|jgi:uncharacterized protein YyaL (SSP411 family)
MPSNRLANESSPYLLQHAHNPVDWYPWGDEAFAAARAQDKPIFLSVGYSSCYWCHVMERQSFENPQIAAEMNRRFINVKVDREERPDVDQLYMNAVHVVAGQGGWPMSVFLTPNLKPFYAGTYFPPTDSHGRVGFPRLLAALDDAWQTRRDDVLRSADQILQSLRQMAQPPPRSAVAIDLSFLDELLDRSTSDFDPVAGGFGSAPKFPRQTLLEFILASQRALPNPGRMKQLCHTLDAMAAGGIHDHLGGAFHRYSTDDQWLVPHFEIMLYDNAMLAWVFAEAHSQTAEPRYARVTRGILDFILREMTDPSGGFFTAFDAEVDAREGLSYLWTPEEITKILGPDATLFNRVYGVDAGPNFADPYHGDGRPDKNILFLPAPIDLTTDDLLAPLRQKLYARRRQRKQPLLDTKILTSWNALMIRALAHAGQILNEPRYLAAANRAVDFLLQSHANAAGGLHRMSRDNRPKGDAFLDDYAFLAQALLALGRRDDAKKIADQMRIRFLDETAGGFFFTAPDAPDILIRHKSATDSPLPSGNGVAAAVMWELGEPKIAQETIAAFASQLYRFGESMSALAQAALQSQSSPAASAPAKESSATESTDLVALSADWLDAKSLRISAAIAPGFHLNSHQSAPGLTPTRLSLSGPSADSIASIDYPAPTLAEFPFADGAIPIYDGSIEMVVRFHHPPADEAMTVILHFQACDQNSCRAAATSRLVIAPQHKS